VSRAATQGARTPPTFDGYPLAGVPAESWEISAIALKGNITLADGSVREQLLAPEPGFPLITWKHTFSLQWGHVGKLQRALEARLAFPGAHRLCVWKHVTLGYLGDGQRSELYLPVGWRVAIHGLTPPEGISPAKFEPEVTLGLDGLVPLPVEHVSTATYEATAPPAGDVWFEEGTNRFRFGTAPGLDEQVLVAVVPEFACLTAGESEARRYSDPMREPRRLVLVET
jgi:hypothetical protein